MLVRILCQSPAALRPIKNLGRHVRSTPGNRQSNRCQQQKTDEVHHARITAQRFARGMDCFPGRAAQESHAGGGNHQPRASERQMAVGRPASGNSALIDDDEAVGIGQRQRLVGKPLHQLVGLR